MGKTRISLEYIDFYLRKDAAANTVMQTRKLQIFQCTDDTSFDWGWNPALLSCSFVSAWVFSFSLYLNMCHLLSLSTLNHFSLFFDKMRSPWPLLRGLLKLYLNHLVTGINLPAWMPPMVATKLYKRLKTKEQQSKPTWIFEDAGTVILSFIHSAFMHSDTES